MCSCSCLVLGLLCAVCALHVRSIQTEDRASISSQEQAFARRHLCSACGKTSLDILAEYLLASNVRSISRIGSQVEPRNALVRMQTNDPLGEIMGMYSAAVDKNYMLWLDLRKEEITFAKQATIMLFMKLRRITDEAGVQLPRNAAIEALLYEEARFDKMDLLDYDRPAYLETEDGSFVRFNANESLPIRVFFASNKQEFSQAVEKCDNREASNTAIALPPDADLWAAAVTGLNESALAPKEANLGA